ncbi:MAG: hypothetical protein KJP18_07295 [Gemmatimonadetes bacterium]|nr:hypothetical protein [Gemmatimonadota bacterium]
MSHSSTPPDSERNGADSRDPALREAFQALKAEDRTRVPDAASMLARARAAADSTSSTGTPQSPNPDVVPLRRRGALRWGVPGLSVALAAAVATVLLMDRAATTPDADFERVVEAWSTTGGAWRSPTDDLLRPPGDELLRTVPRIGGGSSLSRDPRAPRPDGPERESPS